MKLMLAVLFVVISLSQAFAQTTTSRLEVTTEQVVMSQEETFNFDPGAYFAGKKFNPWMTMVVGSFQVNDDWKIEGRSSVTGKLGRLTSVDLLTKTHTSSSYVEQGHPFETKLGMARALGEYLAITAGYHRFGNVYLGGDYRIQQTYQGPSVGLRGSTQLDWIEISSEFSSVLARHTDDYQYSPQDYRNTMTTRAWSVESRSSVNLRITSHVSGNFSYTFRRLNTDAGNMIVGIVPRDVPSHTIWHNFGFGASFRF